MAEQSSPPMVWQIALAQCLLKSKPQGVGFKDYLLQLRKRIAVGSRAAAYETPTQYLDAVSYIRGKFNESQHEIHRLQSKLAALQLDNDALVAARPASKKRAAPGDRSSNRVTKRSKTEDAALKVDIDILGPDLDSRRYSLGDEVVFYLYRILDADKDGISDPASYVSLLVQAAKELGDILDSSLASFHPTQRDVLDSGAGDVVEKDFPQFLRAFARSFGLITRGLSTLSGAVDDGSKSYIGAVCCACATLVNQFLRCMTTLSALGLERPGTSKRKSVAQRSQEKFMCSLTGLFLELLGCLSPEEGGHFALFEGITYILLERCGSLLYTVEFGHTQPATIDEEIDRDQQTFGIDTQTCEASAAAEEARYLLPVVKRIMAMARLFYRQPGEPTKPNASKGPGATRSKSTVPNYKSLAATKLALHAKEKLQQTLIHCIWSEHDEANEFAECLRKPVFQGSLPQIPKGSCDDDPFWFRTEMWRLVGWEILGGEGNSQRNQDGVENF